MHLHDAGISLTFNGEIYNFKELRHILSRLGHSFTSQCDTEVLLAAYLEWGEACVNRLNGMFAFALYDSRIRRLILARDRVGEKPLFYHLHDGTLHFSSELKALLANHHLPRRIDSYSLDCYLAMGYVPGDMCILDGYQKLPPAHLLSFDLEKGTNCLKRYWQLPDLDEYSSHLDEIELVDELESLLDSAVKRQLVADVPVAVLLSGGVDSSLVTAMASRHSTKVSTFSVVFLDTVSLMKHLTHDLFPVIFAPIILN